MAKRHVASGSFVRLGSSKKLSANLHAFEALLAQQDVSLSKSGYVLMSASGQAQTAVTQNPSDDPTTRAKGHRRRMLGFLAAPAVIALLFVGSNVLTEDKSQLHPENPVEKTLDRNADVAGERCSNFAQDRVDFAGVSVEVSHSSCGFGLKTLSGAGDLLADRKVKE